jgi:cytochrome c553
LAKPTSKPNPVSKKMSKTMSEYERKRVAFFALHPFCQARLAGCTIGAAQIHHKAGRGENHNNMSTWLGVCASCHEYIELHPNEAKELGFSVNRLDKE